MIFRYGPQAHTLFQYRPQACTVLYYTVRGLRPLTLVLLHLDVKEKLCFSFTLYWARGKAPSLKVKYWGQRPQYYEDAGFYKTPRVRGLGVKDLRV